MYCRDSAPINILVPGEGIVVETTTKGVKVSNLVIVLAVVGSVFVLIFLAILLILRKRYKNRQKANKKRKGQLRALRHLMSKMSERVGDQDNSNHTDLHDLKHVAFVITGTMFFMPIICSSFDSSLDAIGHLSP